VELRYFAGLTIEEAARVLEISVETAKRDWRMAKAWLLAQLSPAPGAARP
jgi:DNA-directed RNA polymerase specialized sigma24 family protein